MQEINFLKPKLHLFVCINDRSNRPNNNIPSCGPKIDGGDVKEVKRWIIKQGLATKIYCTKAQCLGFCNPEGGVAVIYPAGKFYKGIKNVEDLKEIIKKEI